MLIPVFICLGILVRQNCVAQKVEMGILSSPKHVGITSVFNSKSGTSSILRLYADMYGVLDGMYSSPGYIADYHALFPINSKTLDSGACLDLRAGPGAMAGCAYDRNVDFKFNVPVVISLGFSGTLGCHVVVNNDFGGTLRIYKNGVYDAWKPELSIRYRF